MMRTFNNGIGMVLVVHEKTTQAIHEFLEAMGEKAYVIGSVVERETTSNQIAWA
jgi:phosphoribosylformylglycinamidine cyclo-ligase